jgi:twitching motility protein PilI
MANREALRELQTRLASRLQAARSGGISIAWLAVKAGESNYLFPLAQSGEIFPLINVQVVPYCRQWFMGVVNLRGGLYGVVDLASLSAMDRLEQTEQSRRVSVITVNAALNPIVPWWWMALPAKRDAFAVDCHQLFLARGLLIATARIGRRSTCRLYLNFPFQH